MTMRQASSGTRIYWTAEWLQTFVEICRRTLSGHQTRLQGVWKIGARNDLSFSLIGSSVSIATGMNVSEDDRTEHIDFFYQPPSLLHCYARRCWQTIYERVQCVHKCTLQCRVTTSLPQNERKAIRAQVGTMVQAWRFLNCWFVGSSESAKWRRLTADEAPSGHRCLSRSHTLLIQLLATRACSVASDCCFRRYLYITHTFAHANDCLQFL